ncbi:MAG TPA: CocE/NonD family hydrolase [Xanthomonadaceae bacterium]|nr:CocE/NonD family hydrolase [Xanthomonadaceae bacterium]
MTPDITGKKYEQPAPQRDFERREVMIPMRDGVKLFTVIMIPKGAHDAPMLFTRTPYNAAKRTMRTPGATRLVDALSQADTVFAQDGYIRVYQDVRGKYGSQGDYVMTRPPRGPLNRTKVDHTTDAWDSIDWLVRHVPESNGRVGMLGSSYEGFTVVMALLDPHPALKVAAPESPMIDGWKGDDWFQNGAYRQVNVDYIVGQTSERGAGGEIAMPTTDDYTSFLRLGSAEGFARYAGLDRFPFWQKVTQHPAYDAFWQAQALDQLLAKLPGIGVPTMWEQGLWDQEDMYGANHSYAVLEPKDGDNTRNFLVIGPWRHSGANYDGSSLGALKFNGDTALQWRRDVLKPFFDQYLKDGAPKADTPPVMVYNSGLQRWDRYARWPQSCDSGCPATSKPLYLAADETLQWQRPADGAAAYVSDPARPVPFVPRPVRMGDRATWTTWLVHDQRFVDGRPDVLSYTTAPLEAPLRLAGVPVANLDASTTGSDSDWVVKLIDVYPDQYPDDPDMAGYQLPVALTIFRGRYREGFDRPQALVPGVAAHYRFDLPNVNHVFLPGHRVMVQVQSTLFPLYDRNPQTFVPNVFLAAPSDYRRATQQVLSSSFIDLPVAPPR